MSNLKPNPNLVEPEPKGEPKANLKPNPNLKANLKANLKPNPNLKANLKEKKFRGSIFFLKRKFKLKKKTKKHTHTHNTNKLNVVYKLIALYLFMLSMN